MILCFCPLPALLLDYLLLLLNWVGVCLVEPGLQPRSEGRTVHGEEQWLRVGGFYTLSSSERRWLVGVGVREEDSEMIISGVGDPVVLLYEWRRAWR